MKSLPKVKEFIDKHAEKYTRLFVEYVGGDPRLALMAEGKKFLKEIHISTWDSRMIHDEIMKHEIPMHPGMAFEES